MAAVKHPTSLQAVCTACQWTGERSLDKGDDLAKQECPRCGEQKLEARD